MKYIAKRGVPESFCLWAPKHLNLKWTEFSKPDSPHIEIYKELRRELLLQQNELCCYCELALEDETDAHIEHLKDQEHNKDKRYDFGNLLASCKHTDSCGHMKGNKGFDTMVSPLNSDCSKRFTYTRQGKIIPKDENDTDAQKTIELLGLNCRRLKDRRRSIISAIDYEWTDFEDTLKNYLEWHKGFYTLIEYVADKYK